MAKIKELIEAPEARIKSLEALVAKQQAQIERLRASKIKPPKASRSKSKNKKTFLRVFVGDSHGAYADQEAVAAFLADLRSLQPAEVVHVGDILEASTFLAQHHTLGVVAQAEYTYEDDVLAANGFLDGIQSACPKARLALICGNHDARIEKACLTWALQNRTDAAFLLSMFSPRKTLNLEKRGVRCLDMHDYETGVNVSGTMAFEFGLLAQHGVAASGQNATRTLLTRLGTHVVHGHNHQLSAVYMETARGVIGGWGVGCLCQRRPLWQLTKPTNWTHGYVLQVVEPGVGFTCIPVPIINGISYLNPLLNAVRL